MEIVNNPEATLLQQQGQNSPAAKSLNMLDERGQKWAETFVNDADPERKRMALASLKKNYSGMFGNHGLEPVAAAFVDMLESSKDAPEFDLEPEA